MDVKQVNMVLNVHRKHKAYLGRGEGGWRRYVGDQASKHGA